RNSFKPRRGNCLKRFRADSGNFLVLCRLWLEAKLAPSAGKTAVFQPIRSMIISSTDSQRHPFLQGLSKHPSAPPTVIVIFGASGDLTARKLVPAIYNLSHDNLLPSDFFLIGYGRKEIPDEEFNAGNVESISRFSRRELSPEIWGRVEANSSYFA